MKMNWIAVLALIFAFFFHETVQAQSAQLVKPQKKKGL